MWSYSNMWSYCLGILGITGFLLVASRRPRVGWSINICAQVVWFVYGCVTRQYGFLVTAAVFAFAYIRLLRAATRVAAPGSDPVAQQRIANVRR